MLGHFIDEMQGVYFSLSDWSLKKKFVGFPPSAQDFLQYIKCTFKRSLRLFRFKILKFVPFLIKNPQNISKICKKGTHSEILNLNNRRLMRLKVHVILQKSLVLTGKTLQKD